MRVSIWDRFAQKVAMIYAINILCFFYNEYTSWRRQKSATVILKHKRLRNSLWRAKVDLTLSIVFSLLYNQLTDKTKIVHNIPAF